MPGRWRDGTLWLSVRQRQAAVSSRAETSAEDLEPVFLEWIAGELLDAALALDPLCEARGLVEAMLETYREYNREHHDALVTEFPGARRAVESLHRLGAKLGVVTSKRRPGTLLANRPTTA